MEEKHTGEVKFFNEEKGFGFIVPDNGSDDVFVHKSNVEKSGLTTLLKGQIVSFDVGLNKKTQKPLAQNIKIVNVA